MFAIKVNDKGFMPDYYRNNDQVLTFTTEKKAAKEVERIKKRHPHLQLDIVEVEEEVIIDFEKLEVKQNIKIL